MNIQNTKEVLKVAIAKRITPLIFGRHGIGKSQMILQLAQEIAEKRKMDFTTDPNKFDDKHFGLVDLRLGQMEAGDLIGMPVPDIEKDKTKWLKPMWFPENENSHGLIFLDELNRGRTDVIQAVFQLVWDRRLATHILPDNWGIVICANPSGSDYYVNELDPALMDRFLIIKLTPEVKEWVAWGKNTERIDITITDFIEKYPEMLGNEQIDIPIKITPTPRSWEVVGKILPKLREDLWLETCAGLIGLETAIPFIENMKKNLEKPIRAEQILSQYPKWRSKIKKFSHPDTMRTDLLGMSCDDTIRVLKKGVSDGNKLSQEQETNLINFLKDIPSDLAFGVVKYIVSNEKMGTDYFNELLDKHSDLYGKLEQDRKFDEKKL